MNLSHITKPSTRKYMWPKAHLVSSALWLGDFYTHILGRVLNPKRSQHYVLPIIFTRQPLLVFQPKLARSPTTA